MRQKHYHIGEDELGDGGMTDPDWDRVLVDKGKISPLGDPNRWGGAADIILPAGFGGSGGTFTSQQFIQVQCADAYPRAWSILGTVKALDTFWAALQEPVTGVWFLSLVVQMGVGQASIVHNFNLRAIVAADEPYYNNTQVVVAPEYTTKAFVIPGAIYANSFQIRVFTSYILGAALPIAAPFTLTTTVLVTPFNPGTGL